MASIFARRLRCFYCGKRSRDTHKGPVRKWQCKTCEAVNYLDENGEITDPPTEETNPDTYGHGSREKPFETIDFKSSDLFCAKCVRNQHLFTSALASYFPSTDDPAYSAYEKDYPKFRKNLEERYPQVCEQCEPRVNNRIRESIYTAKTDFLGRMLERSKAAREARRARTMNWRSWVVLLGAWCYWASVAGQLGWDLMSVAARDQRLHDPESLVSLKFLTRCAVEAYRIKAMPSQCSVDLASYAGVALLVGILALWWNPLLRLVVEGRLGRLAGLGDYYKFQLTVMVARCAFWALLKDPSSSGLHHALPSTLHMFMIFFTVASVVMSRWIIRFDTRPLVDWSAWSPSLKPRTSPDSSRVDSELASLKIMQSPAHQHTSIRDSPRLSSLAAGQSKSKSAAGGDRFGASISPVRDINSTSRWGLTKQSTTTGDEPPPAVGGRFPIEKFGTEPPIPVKKPLGLEGQADEMDWTPTRQQMDLRPNHSVRPAEEQSVLNGPLPFYGQLPPAPKPPAWLLRNPPTQKPIERVVQPNPFHRNSAQPMSNWQPSTQRADVAFAQPKFFPQRDYDTSTGLETLFDRTFTMKTPGEEQVPLWQSTSPQTEQRPHIRARSAIGLQFLRVFLLLASIGAWMLSQNELLFFPGNYVEVSSLGSVSLIAGFSLLDVLKRPMSHWDGREMLIYFAELAAAVHLGGHLPKVSFRREYFDRYGKLLLVFTAVQEILALWSLCRESVQMPAATSDSKHRVFGAAAPTSESPRSSPPTTEFESFTSANSLSNRPPSPTFGVGSSFALQQAPSQLGSTYAGSTFSSQASTAPRQPAFPSFSQPFVPSKPLSSANLRRYESEDSDRLDDDSDRETTVTTATTATTATNFTVQNIRLGLDPNWREPVASARSQRRSTTGALLSGLSLDDQPARRVTRSQARQRRV